MKFKTIFIFLSIFYFVLPAKSFAKCKPINEKLSLIEKEVAQYIKKEFHMQLQKVNVCIDKSKFLSIPRGRYHKSVFDLKTKTIFLRDQKPLDFKHELFHVFINQKMGPLPYSLDEKLARCLVSAHTQPYLSAPTYDQVRFEKFIKLPLRFFNGYAMPEYLTSTALMILKQHSLTVKTNK